MDKINVFLAVIIIGLMLYITFSNKGQEQAYLKELKAQRELIEKEIAGLQSLINSRLDTLKIINQKETIIKNYYNEILQGIDTLNSVNSVNFFIRAKLDTLGTARLD